MMGLVNEFEKMQKEAVIAQFLVYPSNCLKNCRKW
jgi:hypothetical protein